MVFSGTLVLSGNGKAVVYATGMDTQIGGIVKLTKETGSVDTPLHREINHFIKIISSIAIFLGVLFFIMGVLLGERLIGSLIFAIGIIVANVPEGLLPTVTLALSMASKRMSKKNALIKNLESVETLGSTTVICTDKTGTLTENKMVVNTLFINLEGKNVYEKDLSESKNLDLILNAMTLCNNARMNEDGNFTGDPTETALLNFSKNFIDISELKEKEPRIHESPFDSKTRRMITTNRRGFKKIAYLKGAPEVVLGMSDCIALGDEIINLTPKEREKIIKYYEKLASRGERVLAFAYRETETDKTDDCGFIFTGLLGMLDPPKKEVPDALKKCKTAGIRVIMITGDFRLTADAVARKIGLIKVGEKSNITTGEMLDKLSDSELEKELNKENIIFARTNPLQKLRIVKALQAMGEVVTVTGDGVNDAPALKNADMGVSMGISGTEVAREASDMVLMDDNFATIVSAVEEGRTIFDNIKKFIAYVLTSNVPEILPFIAFVLLSIPLPLPIILILAIDLGTDILPAIGLGAEKPESDVMKKPPRSRKERLLTPQLLFISYGIIGAITAAAGFFTFFYILFSGGWIWGQELAFNDPLYTKAVAGFFASIVICQIADVIICRTRRQSIFKAGFLTNKLIILGIITELILLYVILYFPPAQTFFGTNSLTPFELSLSVPFALLILLGDEVRRFFVRRDNEFVKKYLTW
jgi:sodium/potassium-transporting ATPase subunit alpha